jgi:alkylated DNA repair protein (DNA oxidative demethylase)
MASANIAGCRFVVESEYFIHQSRRIARCQVTVPAQVLDQFVGCSGGGGERGVHCVKCGERSLELCPNAGKFLNNMLNMRDLLSDRLEIRPGMMLFKGFADSAQLAPALQAVIDAAPLRRLQTSRGFPMSVQTSNCGQVGWISDRRGYRYSPTDPRSGKPWPHMPTAFSQLAGQAAGLAGYPDFQPDACLINHYEPGTQMGAHQDRDEVDFAAPIVSVSLGIDARFFVIGPERRGHSTAVDLQDGDVLVFGGPARLFYHGVRRLKPSHHPTFGAVRWNLTFRKAC